MRNDRLATHWRSLNNTERIEWLKRLHTVDIAITVDELDVSVEELDSSAIQAGLCPIRKTVVDVAGQRDWEYGVQGPKFAQAGRLRKWHRSLEQAVPG